MRLRFASAIAAVTLSATAAGCGIGDLTGGGYDYSDTLSEVRDDFGKDARVISILDRDGDVTFVVIGSDGRVHERDYEYVCGRSGGSRGGTSCSKHTKNMVRAPLRGERDLARARLGELDEDVVDDLRDRTDAFGGAPVGLKGRRWVVASGVFEAYVADLDGSNVHRAESAADRAFANSVSPGAGERRPGDKGGSASGPPPELPAPPGQLAQGRPDFAAFGEAINALEARIGARGRLFVANVDDGIVSFEYIGPKRYVYKVKWDPMERKLVDGGQPFSDGTEPTFPLSVLDAGRIREIARAAATKEHAEKTPGVLVNVSGGRPTASMIVHGPGGSQAYDAPL
jgi:hypothetical protein